MEKIMISKQYLEDAVDKHSRKLVGQSMRRFEILKNTDDVKNAVKELIYEEFRNFKNTIEAYSCGMEFVSKNKPEK